MPIVTMPDPEIMEIGEDYWVAMVEADDPRLPPTTPNHDGDLCPAGHFMVGLGCTLPRGHDGWHAGGGTTRLLGEWA
jgi:hypothetical protein